MIYYFKLLVNAQPCVILNTILLFVNCQYSNKNLTTGAYLKSKNYSIYKTLNIWNLSNKNDKVQ